MPIHVALLHKTHYTYDRPVAHAPHVVRLRPAPHCRTPILSYSQKITGGKVANAPARFVAYGCGSCHVIPGIDGANGKVGPDLNGIAKRAAIAGSLPNDPKAMILWLQHPQILRPGSAMPEMGVTDPAARDMAAYLYSRS